MTGAGAAGKAGMDSLERTENWAPPSCAFTAENEIFVCRELLCPLINWGSYFVLLEELIGIYLINPLFINFILMPTPAKNFWSKNKLVFFWRGEIKIRKCKKERSHFFFTLSTKISAQNERKKVNNFLSAHPIYCQVGISFSTIENHYYLYQ